MIHKTSLLRYESLSFSPKVFKLLNKREERPSNVGKTVVIFPHISGETSGALVRLAGITKAENY